MRAFRAVRREGVQNARRRLSDEWSRARLLEEGERIPSPAKPVSRHGGARVPGASVFHECARMCVSDMIRWTDAPATFARALSRARTSAPRPARI